MMRLFKILALILPILVPALIAGKTVYERSNTPVYMVRIEGYDPRDLLYGHYLLFRFAPEKSAQASTFPDDIAERLKIFNGRYYIPEAQAHTLDTMLRDEARVMEIEVGVPNRGKAFMRDLYIDGKPMVEALRDFENRVDLDSHTEGE